MKFGVLLSGCGVYDGAEIHESVLTLLALDQKGIQYEIIAPDVPQHHVINHLTGDEMPEKRNVRVEAARIARGHVVPAAQAVANDYDALVLPGGFGAAKNLTKWAFSGPEGEIEPSVQALLLDFATAKKPIGALCMAPAVLARAFKGLEIHPTLTVGSPNAPSPYDIAGVMGGIDATGAKAVPHLKDEVEVDAANLIVTAPCYMMEASITDVYNAVVKVVDALVELIEQK